jgi:VIT1/CCC1 family predicted Fe2+/Mn2+ transporter
MRVFRWIRPHIPESCDGILTSAGICEGFADAGVSSGVLYGITAATRIATLRGTLAVSAAFAAGALLPWLSIVLIPGQSRALVTFVVVLAALALTGRVSARIRRSSP